jgi:hypothetical protein
MEEHWNADRLAEEYVKGTKITELYKHAFPSQIYSALRARNIPLRRQQKKEALAAIRHGPGELLEALDQIFITLDDGLMQEDLTIIREAHDNLDKLIPAIMSGEVKP